VIRKNILRYTKFSRMFLQNVKCLRYGTLRYVTWEWKTRIRDTIRFRVGLQLVLALGLVIALRGCGAITEETLSNDQLSGYFQLQGV